MIRDFPGGIMIKKPPANTEHAGNVGSISGSGRSSGIGNGNLLQYSCLEKSHGQRSPVGYSPWVAKELNTAYHKNNYGRDLWLPANIHSSFVL